MMLDRKDLLVPVGCLLLLLVPCTSAELINFDDRDAWFAAVGEVTTIDFVFPEPVIVTDQYGDLGVIFVDGNDVAFHNAGGFPNDEWGLQGYIVPPGEIHVQFDAPMNWIAVEFPGQMQFELYRAGRLVGFSHEFFSFPDPGDLGGVVSPEAFDEVFITCPGSATPFIDDLHFGGVSADFDDDGVIGPFDLAVILGNWGDCREDGVFCPPDLNLDGEVGPADLAILLGTWGVVP